MLAYCQLDPDNHTGNSAKTKLLVNKMHLEMSPFYPTLKLLKAHLRACNHNHSNHSGLVPIVAAGDQWPSRLHLYLTATPYTLCYITNTLSRQIEKVKLFSGGLQHSICKRYPGYA